MCAIDVSPVVSTERLVLRGPTVSDAGAIAALASDRNVAGMTGRIPHPYGLADAEAFIARAQQTDWGREAEVPIREMGRWAARSPRHNPFAFMSTASAMTSLRTLIDPVRAAATPISRRPCG